MALAIALQHFLRPLVPDESVMFANVVIESARDRVSAQRLVPEQVDRVTKMLVAPKPAFRGEQAAVKCEKEFDISLPGLLKPLFRQTVKFDWHSAANGSTPT